jgi:hypothetical protein
MIVDMELPASFWDWAMEAAVHVTNVMPTKANVGTKTPYEAYWGILKPAAAQPRFAVTGAANTDRLVNGSD